MCIWLKGPLIIVCISTSSYIERAIPVSSEGSHTKFMKYRCLVLNFYTITHETRLREYEHGMILSLWQYLFSVSFEPFSHHLPPRFAPSFVLSSRAPFALPVLIRSLFYYPFRLTPLLLCVSLSCFCQREMTLLLKILVDRVIARHICLLQTILSFFFFPISL